MMLPCKLSVFYYRYALKTLLMKNTVSRSQ